MAALDHVDSVDLHVSQVRHRCGRSFRAAAEGLGGVQALGMQPDSARLGGGQSDDWIIQLKCSNSLVTAGQSRGEQ